MNQLIFQVIINALDLELRAADITAVSAYVTWRFFDAQEKPYIDGVQLRYIRLWIINSHC